MVRQIEINLKRYPQHNVRLMYEPYIRKFERRPTASAIFLYFRSKVTLVKSNIVPLIKIEKCKNDHFSSPPTTEVLHSIYNSILSQHLRNSGFSFPIQVVRSSDLLVQLTLATHCKITQTFLPTATKFHYVFNLKDLTNLFQVMIPFLIHLDTLSSTLVSES